MKPNRFSLQPLLVEVIEIFLIKVLLKDGIYSLNRKEKIMLFLGLLHMHKANCIRKYSTKI